MAFHIAVLSIAFVSITFFSKSGNKADNSDLTVIVVSNQFNSCGEDILYTKDFDVHDVKNCFAALSLVISALLQNGQFFELLWSIKTFVIRWKISSSINSIFSHSLILSLTFLAKLSIYSWIIWHVSGLINSTFDDDQISLATNESITKTLYVSFGS